MKEDRVVRIIEMIDSILSLIILLCMYSSGYNYLNRFLTNRSTGSTNYGGSIENVMAMVVLCTRLQLCNARSLSL